jgi:hypothetical protein
MRQRAEFPDREARAGTAEVVADVALEKARRVVEVAVVAELAGADIRPSALQRQQRAQENGVPLAADREERVGIGQAHRRQRISTGDVRMPA